MRSFILKSLSMAPSPHKTLSGTNDRTCGSGTRHLVYIIETSPVNPPRCITRDRTVGLMCQLLANCGYNTSGGYINTLTMTDVATGWTVCTAFSGSRERFRVDAIDAAESSIPFAVRGIDYDNGSEFINAHIKHAWPTNHAFICHTGRSQL